VLSLHCKVLFWQLRGETEEKHAQIVGDETEPRIIDLLHTRLELDLSIRFVGEKRNYFHVKFKILKNVMLKLINVSRLYELKDCCFRIMNAKYATIDTE